MVYTSTCIKVWQELEKRLGVQLHCNGFHVYCRVWLPHLGQRLSAEREHENAEDRFAIAVREHSDTRADEDVNQR